MLLAAYFQETCSRFHALGSATFRKAMKHEKIAKSELLPDLDTQHLATYVNSDDQFDTVMAFRNMMRSLGT